MKRNDYLASVLSGFGSIDLFEGFLSGELMRVFQNWQDRHARCSSPLGHSLSKCNISISQKRHFMSQTRKKRLWYALGIHMGICTFPWAMSMQPCICPSLRKGSPCSARFHIRPSYVKLTKSYADSRVNLRSALGCRFHGLPGGSLEIWWELVTVPLCGWVTCLFNSNAICK